MLGSGLDTWLCRLVLGLGLVLLILVLEFWVGVRVKGLKL